jgi:hypothetical protein
MAFMRTYLCGLLVLVFPGCLAAQLPGPVPSTTPQACPKALHLTPEAGEVAVDIGVTAQLDQLRAVLCESTPAAQLQLLMVRQRITDAVVVASLDVDGVAGQIDFERAQILEKRDLLTGNQNHAVTLLSLASLIVGSGSGIVSNVLQFNNSTVNAGNGIGAAGGAGGVILSILGLRISGGAAALGLAPNMLAQVFDRHPGLHSAYPADVWAYLNTVQPAYAQLHQPWRQVLIDDWIHEKRLAPLDTPKAQKEIDRLTTSSDQQVRLSLKLLTDRELMLLDTGARVELMKGALRDLLRAVSETSQPPASQAAATPLSSPR